MNYKRALAFLLPALLFSPVAAQEPPAAYSVKTEDVCEAALRYSFRMEGTDGAKTICVSSAVPLSLDFIHRFAKNDPAVVWSIRCTSSFWGGVRDSRTNEPAVGFEIASVRWVSSEEALVKVSSPRGHLPSRERKIHMVRYGQSWRAGPDSEATRLWSGQLVN